ncbi:hypothetical protein, partial [Aliarcobacter butzleri]|uniref:hypothetical protein n=1 Tax=Aliarcobacter butzleri TaxID=28197 RepID=UPI001EDAD999
EEEFPEGFPLEEKEEPNIDINVELEKASETIAILDNMGISKATFKTGTTFQRNETTNTAILATDGLIVQQREHTTSITYRNENSSKEEALKELSEPDKKTQEILGSFSGKSQSWVSNKLTNNKQNDD